MVFDPTYADIDMSSFKLCDWKEFYGEATEEMPPNMPEPRGKEIELRLYVDSDHAGDQLLTHWILYLPKFSSPYMVFQAATHCGNCSLWCRICCTEKWNGMREGTTV
jgi:hypothetical protein